MPVLVFGQVMDTEHNYLAAGLFSPSKARAQEAAARDWAYIDSWLTSKYTPERVPAFERNEDTLSALLSLAAANERADELRDVNHEVEALALHELNAIAQADENATTYDAIEASLTKSGSTALDSLSTTSVILNATDSGPETLASRIIETTDAQFELDQQFRRMEALRQAVAAEQQRLELLLEEINGPTFAISKDLPQKTAEWSRESKNLKAKLAEYNDRLSTANVTIPKPSLDDITAQNVEGRKLRARVAELERRSAVYHSLPANAVDAREQLEMARTELQDLIQRRDHQFQRMAGPKPG